MPSVGPLELALFGVILLLLFGAKRLPEVGRSLGSGMREFKKSLTLGDGRKSDRKETDRVD